MVPAIKYRQILRFFLFLRRDLASMRFFRLLSEAGRSVLRSQIKTTRHPYRYETILNRVIVWMRKDFFLYSY